MLLDMGFASCIHEAGHAVVGIALGFGLDRVEVSDQIARAVWNLGTEAENAREPATSGESRSALVDAVRADEQMLDRFRRRASCGGGSEDRLLPYHVYENDLFKFKVLHYWNGA